VNEEQKQFLNREYQALWKAHGAMALENRVLNLDFQAPADPVDGTVAPATLESVRRALGGGCASTLCAGRKNLVFGAGNPNADLLFLGDAPAGEDDAQGQPFRGNAGELLTKIIEAMGFTREQVYLTQVVKCRPPQNRSPNPEEVAACLPHLQAQIGAVAPRVVVALGPVACAALLGGAELSDVRGNFTPLGWDTSTLVMPTFHPSYLLRTPAAKKTVWEDMKQVMNFLEQKTEKK
jgi:uracil-DNA glycosylase